MEPYDLANFLLLLTLALRKGFPVLDVVVNIQHLHQKQKYSVLLQREHGGVEFCIEV
jgi:hypothetical protein